MCEGADVQLEERKNEKKTQGVECCSASFDVGYLEGDLEGEKQESLRG